MTKEEWKELDGKQQWDIQVALRGPDCQHSEPIKWLTTSVLRWAMHKVMRVGGTLNEDLKIMVVPHNVYGLDKVIGEAQPVRALRWSPTHFFNHVLEAAQTCHIPVVGVDNDTYVRCVSASQPPVCVLKLWEWLKDQPDKVDAATELKRHLQAMWGWDAPLVLPQINDHYYPPTQHHSMGQPFVSKPIQPTKPTPEVPSAAVSNW